MHSWDNDKIKEYFSNDAGHANDTRPYLASRLRAMMQHMWLGADPRAVIRAYDNHEDVLT